jgi:hypothetical protein
MRNKKGGSKAAHLPEVLARAVALSEPAFDGLPQLYPLAGRYSQQFRRAPYGVRFELMHDPIGDMGQAIAGDALKHDLEKKLKGLLKPGSGH